MNGDLIAWAVVGGLGIAVVVLGLRRNLSETTRNGLPRFEAATEMADALPGPSEGRRWREPLSPRQRRWTAAFYLLYGLTNAAFLVLSSHERTLHAISAAVFTLGAVIVLLWRSPGPSDGSAS